jgi:hypothetical protein
MDTLGGLIDKLNTVGKKMFIAQDLLYEIRHMSFKEFYTEFHDEDGMEILWERFRDGMDLNLQRNQLIDEIDEMIVEMIQAGLRGDNLDDGKFIQRKNKTY